jgi:maltose-binding protein MalE
MKIRACFILFLLFMMGCSKLQGSEGPGAQGTTSFALTKSPSEASVLPPTRTPFVTPSPTIEITQGTVTIWHSWDEKQAPLLDQILKEFQATYPDVLFDVLYLPQENLRERFEMAFQDGSEPDILLGPAEWGPPLFQTGLLADLNDLAGGRLLDTINPAALDAARYQGALTGLPYAQEGVVLYRNKALIGRAANTLDELITQAKAATQGEIIGADLEQSLFFSGGHLNGIGGSLMTPDGMPAFNNERGLAWLELLKAFEQAGPTEYLSDRDLDLFKEGRVGWIIDGTWNLSSLSEAIGPDNLAIDPWPSYDGGKLAGYVRPTNIYLSGTTQGDDRKAAWKFIEYFLSADAQSRLADAGMIPVVSDVKKTNPRQDLLFTQVMTALTGGVAYPALPEMQDYLGPLDVALQSVLHGNTSPEEALNTAEQAILTALALNKATPTPNP